MPTDLQKQTIQYIIYIMKRTALLLLATCLAAAVFAQFSKPRREYVDFLVTANHPDRIYSAGDDAVITVEAYKGGLPLDGVMLHFSAGEEMMPPTLKDSLPFRNGKAHIAAGTLAQPGFKECSLRFTVYGKTYKETVKLAFSPDSIKPYTVMPADFDKFWKKTLKACAATPLDAEVTPLPAYSTDTVEVSLVKLTVGAAGRHVYGYLTRPRDGKVHPVLFCPPGAGASRISPTTYYSERGFIYFNINIHNDCNPEADDAAYERAKAAVEGYNRRGIAAKETFYYREVYAACSRCIDFLCSLPDWDGINVGVTGGSQGGALSIVTAALNPKVTFCSPFYPALCDLTGFRNHRAGGWPKYYEKTEEEPGADVTMQYYDVVNFARVLKCPVFYSFGYNDPTCSPTSTYAAYNVITAPKTLRVTPTSGHWRFPETNDESVEWMQNMAGIKR